MSSDKIVRADPKQPQAQVTPARFTTLVAIVVDLTVNPREILLARSVVVPPELDTRMFRHAPLFVPEYKFRCFFKLTGLNGPQIQLLKYFGVRPPNVYEVGFGIPDSIMRLRIDKGDGSPIDFATSVEAPAGFKKWTDCVQCY